MEVISDLPCSCQQQPVVCFYLIATQAQAREDAKHRPFWQWLQSHNLDFYNAMMWCDQNYLSKWLVPPDTGDAEAEGDGSGHHH